MNRPTEPLSAEQRAQIRETGNLWAIVKSAWELYERYEATVVQAEHDRNALVVLLRAKCSDEEWASLPFPSKAIADELITLHARERKLVEVLGCIVTHLKELSEAWVPRCAIRQTEQREAERLLDESGGQE